jgi:hypothetical protein
MISPGEIRLFLRAANPFRPKKPNERKGSGGPDMTLDTRPADSPATIVAIIVAAHKIGDRELERMMRARLKQDHGVKLVFVREQQEARHER